MSDHSDPGPAADRAPDQPPTLAARVRAQSGVAWLRAKALCCDGRVTVNGERCLDPAMRVAPDAIVVVDPHARRLRAGALDESAVVHADRDVVVVDKPAGMLSVADEAGNNDTMVDHTRTLLRRLKRGADVPLGVVHRLDRDTSGLMMFTRTTDAKRILGERFRLHEIERVYHAIVHGLLSTGLRIESDLVADRGDGLRGSSEPGHGAGRTSVTFVEPVAALDGATLVECRLETGRQHQIRIHLSESGHPLVGESVYRRDYRGRTIKSPRTMLHARVLGFDHPRRGDRLRFEREPPEDFVRMVAALQRSGR